MAKKISAFRPQAKNANQHTQRGLGMLDSSIADNGWIGAITVSADGETFDGSARLEVAYTRFGEDVEPIIVESDGTKPIVVKRIDIPTADDPRAKSLAIAANRIAQVDLAWDTEVLAELKEEIDLSPYWRDDELDGLLGILNDKNDTSAINAQDESYLLQDGWRVLVDCRSEAEQQQVLEKLIEDGHECRALIS